MKGSLTKELVSIYVAPSNMDISHEQSFVTRSKTARDAYKSL